MPEFSQTSSLRLKTCHPDLQRLFNEVIKHYDCTIIEGHRTAKRQNAAFLAGKSRLKFPLSMHNQIPSRAVDVAPYPIDWDDTERFYYFSGIVKGMAIKMGIPITCGSDWDDDGEVKDQRLQDLVHFELKGTVYVPPAAA